MTLKTVADDGFDRQLPGLLVVAHDVPIGCIGGSYPECNVLLPIWHYAIGSKTPAAKTIPVTVHAEDDRVLDPQLEYATGRPARVPVRPASVRNGTTNGTSGAVRDAANAMSNQNRHVRFHLVAAPWRTGGIRPCSASVQTPG